MTYHAEMFGEVGIQDPGYYGVAIVGDSGLSSCSACSVGLSILWF